MLKKTTIISFSLALIFLILSIIAIPFALRNSLEQISTFGKEFISMDTEVYNLNDEEQIIFHSDEAVEVDIIYTHNNVANQIIVENTSFLNSESFLNFESENGILIIKQDITINESSNKLVNSLQEIVPNLASITLIVPDGMYIKMSGKSYSYDYYNYSENAPISN